MTTGLREPTAREVVRPVMREGRMHCPRCDGRLLFDWEALQCVACGYEYLPEPAELSRYFGRRSERRVAGIAAAIGLVAGLGAVPVLGKVGVVVSLTLAGALLAGDTFRALRRRRGAAR